MTREERRQRRQSNWLMAICIGIIAVWIAALVLSCNANAACETTEAVSESDTFTTVLAIIGACWVSWTLIRAIEWLDKPHENKNDRSDAGTSERLR